MAGSKKKIVEEVYFLPATVCAQAIGVSRNTFDRRWRNRLGETDQRGEGRMVKFSIQAVVKIWASDLRAEAALAARDLPIDDGITGDASSAADSPEMRRLRRARAELAELDVDERRQKLVSRDDVHQALARQAAMLRSLGEHFSRMGDSHVTGSEAHRLLNQTLHAFERSIETDPAIRKVSSE
jgi:hypothetical protein